MSARNARRRIATAVGVLALVASAAACSSSAGADSTPTTHTAGPTTTKKPNAYYDAGDTVTITATAFVPHELVAEVNVPLHFVNRTKVAQRVQFDHSRDASGRIRASGVIAPGATWTFTPTSWESATYHSLSTPVLRGQIQIQPPANP